MIVQNVYRFFMHYSDVTMSTIASQITGISMFVQQFVLAHVQEYIKAPQHWPLWRESTNNRWNPLTKGLWRGKCFHLITSRRIWDNYTNVLNLAVIALTSFKST